MDIYGLKDYRSVIAQSIQNSPERGCRSRLAQAAQCSPSWITRVLNGSVHLTPDQAFSIAQHLTFNESETDYFLLLLEHERAATSALRNRITAKVNALRTEGRALRSGIRTDSSISEKDRVRYHSSWLFAVIHVLCMIAPLSLEEISSRLRTTREVVKSVLVALEEMGLLFRQSGKWEATSRNIHLPSTHVLANLAHANWRQRTLQLLQEPREAGFHYSAVHCLSRSDVEWIRALLKETILNCRKRIEHSPSETLSVLCLDWYEL
ncbi:MAG TPA: TIGR02147 family protein [Bdellovibrionota bacterium]|nr:TIGR02147 family protein [Bdellovibrionota bacterium]